MTEPQPKYVWAYPQEKTKRRRVWLIVVLVIVALAIAGALLWFFLRPGAMAQTDPPATPSATPTVPMASSTPTPIVSAPPEPTQAPTPPPVADPSTDAFKAQVGGWLDDALTGLDIVARTSGQDALTVIDSLQDDAQRLAEARPPSLIAAEWSDGVTEYAQLLAELRSAVSQGSKAAVEDAGSAAQGLRSLVGL